MSEAGGAEKNNDGFQEMSISARRKPKKDNNNNSSNKKVNRQRRSSNNLTGKRQPNKRRGKKAFTSGGPSLSTRGWSKPSEEWNCNGGGNEIELALEKSFPTEEDSFMLVDGSSEMMASEAMASDFAKAGTTADDKINDALASTAASMNMASLMNYMGFAAKQQQQQQTQSSPSPPLSTKSNQKEGAVPSFFSSFAKGQKMEDLLGDLGERDPHWKEKQFPVRSHDGDDDDDERNIRSNNNNNNYTSQTKEQPPPDFSAFCKGQSASELLADFGQADPNWKQKIIVEEEQQQQHAEEDKQHQSSPQPKKARQKPTRSKLAPHGKAAIHLSIESFGIAHGAPSRGARDRSGSPHTQPLEWLTVGNSILDPVPEHLEFHDGLRSGVIKRLLKTCPLVVQGTRTEQDQRGCWNDDDDDDDESSVDLQSFRDFSHYCREHLAGTKIFPSLLEAIHEGGHGYVNPLTMRFSIGSSLGRHRSVVATEWVAQHLRHLLRNHNDKILLPTTNNSNSNNGLANDTNAEHQKESETKTIHTQACYNPKDRRPITCSVSVGTVHRDVNKRIPQKHYREDDEDYVDSKDRF